jgi:RimJ/RimL family protein N-acetyltransferase
MNTTQTEQRLGESLPDDVLARRDTLPLKPAPVTLTGTRVQLRPLDLEHDLQALYEVSNGSPIRLGDREIGAYDADAMIWRYMKGGPFGSAEEMGEHLREQVVTANGLALCVVDRATEMPVGVVNYLANEPQHLKVELGNIWYSPVVQRTGANAEATWLLLNHAFDLGYRRLEWKCDSLNERSRHAAIRMGFTFEGIQESHYIVKGRNRDTAWFRILASEWPDVRANLERLLPS